MILRTKKLRKEDTLTYNHQDADPNYLDGELTEDNWKTVPGFPWYVINPFGEIRTVRTGRIHKQQSRTRGFVRAILQDRTGKSNVYIHRILAEAFLPDYDPTLMVKFKDGNKENVVVHNLQMAHRNVRTSERFRE